MNRSTIQNIIKRNDILLIFIASLLLYGISAGLKIDDQTKTPQYIFLAYSFLQGKLNLTTLPKSTYDLILFQNKWYVPGGMALALLLMPVVAVAGVSISDVLIGVIIGSLNVALMYILLGDLTKKTSTRIWLTILFAAGTVHWWLSSVGSVWFNTQLVAVFFMILFVRDTLRNHPWLAGLWLGFAALSRPPVLFSLAFYLTFVLSYERNFRLALKRLLPFGVMIAGTLAVMLTYNYVRFGKLLEFGYGYVHGAPELTGTYAATGGFNVKYMPCNMYVSLFGLPNIAWTPLLDIHEACSYLEPASQVFGKLSSFFNPLGMSVFLTTPAFLLIFRAKLRDDLVIPSWVGIVSVLIPLWMYHTTGWVQFGYRYMLDFIVFLFILLSRGIKQIGYLEQILIGISVIMGAIGLYLMYYMIFGLVWPVMFIDMARKIYHFVF